MRPGSAARPGAGALGSAGAGGGALGSAGAGGGALGSAGAGGGALGSAGGGGGAFGSPGEPCMKVLPDGGGGGVGGGSGSAWATDGSARATTAAPANTAIVNDFARRLRCSGTASRSCMQTKLQCCCRDASVRRSQSG